MCIMSGAKTSAGDQQAGKAESRVDGSEDDDKRRGRPSHLDPGSAEQRPQGIGIGQIPVDDVDGKSGQQPAVGPRPGQDPDTMPGINQSAHDGRPHESRPTGHDRHAILHPAGYSGRAQRGIGLQSPLGQCVF